MHTNVGTAKKYDLPRDGQAGALEVHGQFKHDLEKPLMISSVGCHRTAREAQTRGISLAMKCSKTKNGNWAKSSKQNRCFFKVSKHNCYAKVGHCSAHTQHAWAFPHCREKRGCISGVHLGMSMAWLGTARAANLRLVFIPKPSSPSDHNPPTWSISSASHQKSSAVLEEIK